MPNQRNVAIVERLKRELEEYPYLMFVDCTGIPVKNMTKLRRQLESSGASLRIAKNRLIKIAMRETEQAKESESYLTGPTGLILMKSDPIPTIKLLYEFIKENERPKVKGLFVFDRIYPGEDFQKFANLRPLEEERAILIGTLQAPMYGLVFALKGVLQRLVMTIEEIKNKQGK